MMRTTGGCSISSSSSSSSAKLLFQHVLTEAPYYSCRGDKHSRLKLVIRLQRYYRNYYLLQKYARAVYLTKKVKYLLHLRCSLIIQSYARLVIAKKDARVQKSLSKIIKDAHPTILTVAIMRHHRQQQRPTQYNKSSSSSSNCDMHCTIKQYYEELFCLYNNNMVPTINNYYLLEGPPPSSLRAVDIRDDILKIGHLISERQTELVARIQSKWREVVARTAFHTYKDMLWSVYAMKESRADIIQTFYRKCKTKKVQRSVQLTIVAHALMESYKAERRQNNEVRNIGLSKQVLHKAYEKSVAEHRVMRYMNGYNHQSSEI